MVVDVPLAKSKPVSSLFFSFLHVRLYIFDTEELHGERATYEESESESEGRKEQNGLEKCEECS
jgi:hypothetical protein